MHPETLQHIFQSRLYIERHLGEAITGERIADEAFLSYFHYQHQFKSLIGESVWQYVKRLRLEKAGFILRYTSLPITDIAYQSGFETPAAFSKAFRNWSGLSPLAYRNQPIQPTTPTEISFEWNEVKTVLLPDQHLVSLRGEGLRQFPKGYFQWLQLIQSLPEQQVTLIGKSPDHPGITPAHKLRWDTCVPVHLLPATLRDELKQQQLLFEEVLPGGQYLVVPFTGFGQPLTSLLPSLLARLRQQGMEWRPSGHFFQSLRQHASNSQCYTDLFIPIV